ncbi:alpha/beta fold hydrolase [Longispora urticae]
MKRNVLLALAVGAGLLVAATPASAARDDLARYHQQRLTWASCADPALDAAGAQCADVTVPLNYDEPRGRTITVAVSRLKSPEPRQRRGVMLSNPGGPGGPGLRMMLQIRTAMTPQVLARYDLIGMDPRGVGRSSPVDCGWPVAFSMRSAGSDRAGFDRDVALQADLARRCAEREGDRLAHITTRNTARDMDVVRAALGERRISYFGRSYGTYLGAVYTQMFPDRADRVVLDSAVDPDRYGPRMFQDLGAPNEAALDDWAAWTARRDPEYHLGTTGPQVRARLQGLIDGPPVTVGGHVVDEHVVALLVFGPLTGRDQYPQIAADVRTLADTAAGRPTPANPALAGSLDYLLRPGPDGGGDAQSAVLCGDVAYPRDPEWYWRNIQRVRASQPIFGPLTSNITACAFWAAPRERTTVVRNDHPALIVQATGDTRTVYRHGVAMHRAMTGSRLVTARDVMAHGLFGSSPDTCVAGAVNTYLATGVLPKADVTCQDDAGR